MKYSEDSPLKDLDEFMWWLIGGFILTPIIIAGAYLVHLYNEYQKFKEKYSVLFGTYETLQKFLEEHPAIDAVLSAAIPGI